MVIAHIKERGKVSTEKSKREEEMAEEAIAVAVTQAFGYIVDQGLSFGYITGGITFIFLYIRRDKPETVYYEKVILQTASTTSFTDINKRLRLTAVGLVAAFIQLALAEEPWNETIRSEARKKLPIWGPRNPQIPVNRAPSPDSSSSNSSPEYKELKKTDFPNTSPAETRANAKSRKGQTGCQEGDNALL